MSEDRVQQNRWELRYRDGETGWDRGRASDALFYWLESEPWPGRRVLVPGCGNGYEVDELARRGYAVTALDIAPTPVSNLRARLEEAGLKARVLQTDLFQWQADQAFDVVYEQTCLCAIEPEQRTAFVERLRSWLRPGGWLLAQFMQTGQDGGPPFHCALADMHPLFPASDWQWQSGPAVEVEMGQGRRELGYRLVRR